ncbi:MAG: glycosyltransferase [Melioribacteraceae bacterium]
MNSKISKPLISVIIPTYNRANYLECALKSLTNQTLPRQEFEVIVVNDGSTDNTIEVCNKFLNSLNLKLFTIQNSGISAAKNLGLFASTAPICLFFDDDDEAHKNLLKEHIITHKKFPQENIAVLGYTTWSSKINISYLMYYITNIGYNLFYYKGFKDGIFLDYTFFWGGRSSCKRSFLVKFGIFNQTFKFGSEDIELGYRLKDYGLKVIFNKNAKSYMIRNISFEDFCRRSEKQGKSLYHFLRLHPTEEVKNYAGLYDAEFRWMFIKDSLEENVQKVKELEKKLNMTNSVQESKAIKSELNNYYSLVFEAYRIKGYVEEYEKHRNGFGITEPSKFIENSFSGIEYLSKKYNNTDFLQPRKRNILVIDPNLPMFNRASGSLRLFHILRSLLALNYHITFISCSNLYSEQYVPILQEMGIEVYVKDYLMNNVDGYLLRLLSHRKYDYALLSFWHVAERYISIIRKYSNQTKIIVDSVDVHFIREFREAEIENHNESQKKHIYERKLRELKTYSEADEIWVVTDFDKKVLEENGINKIINIIPNIHEKINEVKVFENTSDLLFVGNFWHLPNIDAIKYFLKDIFPKVLKVLPHIKLYIVGNHPPKELLNLKSPNIIVTGFVNDISPYLKKARISVAPLRYGAGMKGKIGEALSWGLPVVTTSIGAEGMRLINYYNAVIADNPDDFAKAIIDIYQDKNLWNELSVNGKVHVENNWSVEAVFNKIEKIFNPKPKVSLVVLTHNGLYYSKLFFDSFFKLNFARYELIVIDNASTDNTREYLIKLNNKNNKVKLILNNHNLGFPAGVNQGIKEALGDYILILNNDTIITDNLIERLIEVAESDDKIGIVAPISNEVSGLQKDENAKYNSIEEMHKYAAEIKEKNKGQILHFPRVAFLCTLIKREVIEKIGGLDERFSPGNYEDDDFCLRAQLAGFKTVIAKDVFIHHFGSKSFKANGLDAYKKRLETNRQIFIDKWGATPEEIWLQNKTIKQRQIYYPIDADLFKQYFERTRIHIADNELNLAKESVIKAIENYKEGDAKIISYDELLNLAGNIYLADNDVSKAQEYFEKELNLNPQSSSACYGLGQVFIAQENYEAAKIMFEWAVKNDPSNSSAKSALEKANEMLGYELSHSSLDGG